MEEPYGKKPKDSLSSISNKTLSIIIVNDGSTRDLSPDINHLIKKYPLIKVISYSKNKGKGYAIREGLKNAQSEFFIYTDWDFPFGISIIFMFFQHLQNQSFDLILGKRNLKYFKKLPLIRLLVSLGFKVVCCVLLRFKKIDTQAGIKGLNKKAKQVMLTTTTNSFIFELEFIKKAFCKELKIKSIEVAAINEINFSNLKIKIILKELASLSKMIKRK